MSRVTGKPYFVYALWSEQARRFYVGISENPQWRLEQHNQGLTKWSSRFRPWTLVYEERYETYRLARTQELELKRQKGGQGFFRLTGLDSARFGSRTASGS